MKCDRDKSKVNTNTNEHLQSLQISMLNNLVLNIHTIRKYNFPHYEHHWIFLYMFLSSFRMNNKYENVSVL